MKTYFKLLLILCGLMLAGCGGSGTTQPVPKTAVLTFSLLSSNSYPAHPQGFEIVATLPAGVVPALLPPGNVLDVKAKNGITAFGSYSAAANRLHIAGISTSPLPYAPLLDLNCTINSGNPAAASFNSYTLLASGFDGANTITFVPNSRTDVQFGF